jgi:hypothetical protein
VLGKQIRNDSASIAARQDQREEQLNSREAALAKRLHEIGKQQWKKSTDLGGNLWAALRLVRRWRYRQNSVAYRGRRKIPARVKCRDP